MSEVLVSENVRQHPPPMPSGDIAIQAPPTLPRPTPVNVMQRVLPLVMVAAMVGMVAMMFRSGQASNPMALMFPIMMGVSTLGMVASSFSGSNKSAETNELRKDYLRYLSQTRQKVAANARAQRDSQQWSHPHPDALSTMVGTERMWERLPEDPDFLTVRLGPGRQLLATPIVAPDVGPVEDLEPVSVVFMRRFVRSHALVEDLPVALSLRGFPVLSLDGDVETVRASVRALIAQLVVAHKPDDVAVAVAAGGESARAHWDWVKWLPHHQHENYTDGAGSCRLTERSLRGVEAMLADQLAERMPYSRSSLPVPGRKHLVIIVDDVSYYGSERFLVDAGIDGVTIIEICGSRSGAMRTLAVNRGLCIDIGTDGRGVALTSGGSEDIAAMDTFDGPVAELLAMSMARYRYSADGENGVGESSSSQSAAWIDHLGIGSVDVFDPVTAWRPRSNRNRLRVPIGIATDGSPIELDLKEAAHGGMGPHGLCIGATGSGKSEFLRTLVLGLVATHGPEALNLILVDFKGGATFLGLERLHHVAAVITNLADEMTMVDRMRDALEGEMNRRQQLLRSAGNFAGVADYEAARAKGAPLDPLPALFIVVDEFSELLAQRPEFADLFVQIGRLGRSLQIHLLLASQRLEEGRLRGLESHLSYRIGLKTFSANESRAVLGVTDAYHLPPIPGSGYLKRDADEPLRFTAAYVSGEYESQSSLSAAESPAPALVLPVGPQKFSADYLPVPQLSATSSGRAESDVGADSMATRSLDHENRHDGRSLLEILVEKLDGQGRRAHEVWLPPLNTAISWGSVVDLHSAASHAGALTAPLAIVDRPYEQSREVWSLDLAGGSGNVVVVGGSRSGKSTALRTLCVSLAANYSPDQVHIYGIDYGGGTLIGVDELPHVGSVAHRSENEKVRRTIAEMANYRKDREVRFRELGIDSFENARQRVRRVPGGGAGVAEMREFPDIFLVIDGWQAMRGEHEDLEATVTALASEGLAYGLHLVIAASRWAEIRPALRDCLGSRVELRLGDPGESHIDRRAALAVPTNSPGRGVTKSSHHMLVLAPYYDPAHTSGDHLVQDIKNMWTERGGYAGAVPIRLLPSKISFREVAGLTGSRQDRTMVPFAIDEAALSATYHDFSANPLLLIFGDSEAGKTNLLRVLMRAVIGRNAPGQAKIIVADYRRTMLGLVDTAHLAGYAANDPAFAPMMAQLKAILEERMPTSETTPEQLRNRSWWSGPEMYLIVDDHDLVSTSSSNPLVEIAQYLPHARDVGLNVVIARRSSGAGRALYDPVLSRMKDLGCAAIVLSGSREEGVLVASVRAETRPPGRGSYVTRSRPAVIVQTAFDDDDDPVSIIWKSAEKSEMQVIGTAGQSDNNVERPPK